MKPTPEQLETVARAIACIEGDYWPDGFTIPSAFRYQAQKAWDVIAPIVRAQALEEAAEVADSEVGHFVSDYDHACAVIGNRIRALK